MPAGDLLPTSGETYAAELREYLMADTEDFAIFGVAGLTGKKIKSRRASFGAAPGSAGATDYADEWPLILNMRCSLGSASAAELALVDLQTAWAEADEDIELHLWVPGREHIKVTGRPGDLDPDRVRPMSSGVIRVQARFDVLIPAEENVA